MSNRSRSQDPWEVKLREIAVLPLTPLLLYERVLQTVFWWFIPWFFTLVRYGLAVQRHANRPYFAWMDFRFIYLPGPVMPTGVMQFWVIVLGVIMVAFYLMQLFTSPNAIRDFQKMNVVSYVGFYVAMYGIMALLWLPRF